MADSVRRSLAALAALAIGALLAGCTREVELHSGLAEADANEVLVELERRGIEAGKRQAKQGFIVSVPSGRLAESASLLRELGLPRQRFFGMGEVFRKDGMISTPTEERGRYVYALSQELEKTISQIDGVVLARVHPVLPDRVAPGEPVMPSSCAVLVKHRPGWVPRLYEDKIRRLVAAGIPGLSLLDRSKVSVVFVAAADAPAVPTAVSKGPDADSPRGGSPRLWMALGGVMLLGGAGLLWRQGGTLVATVARRLGRP
jgi:type III secretion protein J